MALSERTCECRHCVGCSRMAFTVMPQDGVFRALCRRCKGGWCQVKPNGEQSTLRAEEVAPMGGQGSGRPKSTFESPRTKHTLTVSNYLWNRLVTEAGGERKVSELLDALLTSYVATLDAKKK